jgi:hypothetical protein
VLTSHHSTRLRLRLVLTIAIVAGGMDLLLPPHALAAPSYQTGQGPPYSLRATAVTSLGTITRRSAWRQLGERPRPSVPATTPAYSTQG